MYVVIRKTKLSGPAEEAVRRTRDHIVPLLEGVPLGPRRISFGLGLAGTRLGPVRPRAAPRCQPANSHARRFGAVSLSARGSTRPGKLQETRP